MPTLTVSAALLPEDPGYVTYRPRDPLIDEALWTAGFRYWPFAHRPACMVGKVGMTSPRTMQVTYGGSGQRSSSCGCRNQCVQIHPHSSLQSGCGHHSCCHWLIMQGALPQMEGRDSQSRQSLKLPRPRCMAIANLSGYMRSNRRPNSSREAGRIVGYWRIADICLGAAAGMGMYYQTARLSGTSTHPPSWVVWQASINK